MCLPAYVFYFLLDTFASQNPAHCIIKTEVTSKM